MASSCIPFAIPQELTGAIVENRDPVTYLVDFVRADPPVEGGTRLAWELPPGARAWAIDVPGRGHGDLVLLSTACELLDSVALDGSTVIAVVDGGTFSSVTEIGQLGDTPPKLQEIDARC